MPSSSRDIAPLQAQDDNDRFFDHRREDARTDWDRGGLPNEEWEHVAAARRSGCADAAGHLPVSAADRVRRSGRDEPGHGGHPRAPRPQGTRIVQRPAERALDRRQQRRVAADDRSTAPTSRRPSGSTIWPRAVEGFAFGITEPEHGSDATHMETTAVRDGDEWIINGEKTWNTGIHKAQYDMIMARTSGKAGDGDGITAFLVPTSAPGFEIVEYLWTFNMPTDHAHIRLTDVRVPHASIFGGEGKGLQVVQHFFNENRIRQAASSLGAAQFCIDQSIEYAKERKPFGKALATNQAIQFPLVELQTQCEMLRALVHKTAWMMDKYGAFSVSDKVSMCNYWANRLCCEAADRAMQVHGGLGYSRHKPFEHIYRHHRRYRITEGAEEIQMRRVAGYMFGFMNQQAPKGVSSVRG